MAEVITVERTNPKGVYAKELGRWLNYSKFYKGRELLSGHRYLVELDGDFIMEAKELPRREAATRPAPSEPSENSNLANSPEYLALKLAVEFAKEKEDFKTGEQVLELANAFKAFLLNEETEEIPF